MYKHLKVCRKRYYEWLKEVDSNKVKQDKELSRMIKIISIERLRTHTAPEELKKDTEHDSVIISCKRIGRLMKESGLTCKTKRKFKATTNSKHNLPIAPNLLNQNFNIALPNRCLSR